MSLTFFVSKVPLLLTFLACRGTCLIDMDLFKKKVLFSQRCVCVYVCAQKRGHRGLAKQKKSASLFKDNTQTIYFVYQHEPFSHLSSLSSPVLSFMYAPSLNFPLFKQVLCLSLVDVCIEIIVFFFIYFSQAHSLLFPLNQLLPVYYLH